MFDTLDADSIFTFPTRTVTEVVEPEARTETKPSLNTITEDVGFVRSLAGTINETVTNLHQHYRAELVQRRAELVRQGGVHLLDQLSDLGFAWRTIARLVGVSVPAVQKWRKGEKMAPENLDKVASLLATCDLVASYPISDVAAWFEIPILPGTPLRPLDLYVADRHELLLDWASHHLIDPVEVLDQFDPDWRSTYHSDFEVFEAGDGELALRRKA